MLRNYLKIAWRNLIKGKLYSFINITGLSIGTAVIVLLALFVRDEKTYDNFHLEGDLIYRAWVKEHYAGEIFFNSVTPYILGQELKENFPDFQEVVRYTTTNASMKKETFSSDELIYVVEPSFLKVFNFPLIEGNINDVLSSPLNVVITPDISKKYFGNENPMGKNISMQFGEEWKDYVVSGIINPAPSNSGFQFNVLLPFENAKLFFGPNAQTMWTNVSVETFVKLKPTANLTAINDKLTPFIDSKLTGIYKPGEYIIGLQKLSDIHLNNEIPTGFMPVGNPRYPFIMSAIALLILILASINFTTLAIARSINRTKEVGIRKTIGAQRIQLRSQFWTEAVLTAGISVLIGIGIARFVIPWFNGLVDKNLHFGFTIQTIGFGLLLVLIIGILSGAYPSFVLSNLSTIKTLRDRISSSGSSRHNILKILVGFQFVLSIVLICCTVIIQKQLFFIQNKDLGFNKDQIMIIPFNKSGVGLRDLMEESNKIKVPLASQISSLTGISKITVSNHTLGTLGWLSVGYTDQVSQKFNSFKINGVDENFIPIHELKIAEGRNFRPEGESDLKSVIINKAYAQEYHLKLNELLQDPFSDYKIIGISEDFNYASLHQSVDPLVLTQDPIGMLRIASDVSSIDSPNPKISLKLPSANISSSIASIEQIWKDLMPDQPFGFSFLDDNFDKLYRSEQRFSFIISLATILAIFIGMLGLFGIATLLIAQRRKEIGIRRVLGADLKNIIFQLNKGFFTIVFLSCIIAIPIAWYVMEIWLRAFEYRTTMSWWAFALAGGFAIFLALIVVSSQSIKASLENPVNALRTE